MVERQKRRRFFVASEILLAVTLAPMSGRELPLIWCVLRLPFHDVTKIEQAPLFRATGEAKYLEDPLRHTSLVLQVHSEEATPVSGP